ERAVIRDVVTAIGQTPRGEPLVGFIQHNISLLDRLGALLGDFPSLFAEQSLGRRRRDLSSLVDMLSRSNGSNFEMFLPTRALIGRNLVMGEMNFYRSLRYTYREATSDDVSYNDEVMQQINRLLCHCLYTRLADEVLSHMASDDLVARAERQKAVLLLSHIWERVTYRIGDYLPVLEATWEARRRVEPVFGTLMGSSEMFRLIQAGCDERFVDYLVRPNHTSEEAGAFREFLFGASTEQLNRLETKLREQGQQTVSRGDLDARTIEPGRMGVDPALAMFEFFLSRHMQASARRQAGLAGPKRTAEEYVMLHYLEEQDDDRLSIPPSSR
ncbi:MAG: hypothetical protein VB934_10095, partial [Polyangiaceae bacterium]